MGGRKIESEQPQREREKQGKKEKPKAKKTPDAVAAPRVGLGGPWPTQIFWHIRSRIVSFPDAGSFPRTGAEDETR